MKLPPKVLTYPEAVPAARIETEPAAVPCPGVAGDAAGVESDLGWALATVVRAFRQSASTALVELPGGPRGYLVLTAVAGGAPRSQLALAQQLGVDKTAMTYLLDDLERGGLVERRPDPADRRARQVVVTTSGTEALQRFRELLTAAEDRLLSGLDQTDATNLRDLLGRVARSVQADPGACLVALSPTDPPC
jgi:DNA-binding MarR family transcriptional regulator